MNRSEGTMATRRGHHETAGRVDRRLRSRRGICCWRLVGVAERHTAMGVEVTVTNPAYWSDRALQLAQLLRGAGEGGGPTTIGDPTGKAPDPQRLMAIADPAYWSREPRELAEVLAVAAGATDAATRLPGGAAGAGSGGQERLTMTVEEAAVALGISRAFAYEAVTRNEIPHVRIGRRILVPRAALHRMLEGQQGDDGG